MANVPSASHGVGPLCHSPSERLSPDFRDRARRVEQFADNEGREVRGHGRELQPDFRPGGFDGLRGAGHGGVAVQGDRAGKQRRTLRNQGHRIEPLAKACSEHGPDSLAQEWGDCRPPRARLPHCQARWRPAGERNIERALNERGDERLILRPGDNDIQLKAPSVRLDPGQKNRRLCGAGQLDLGFLGGNPQAAQRSSVLGIAAVQDKALGGKLGEHEIDEGAVEIAPRKLSPSCPTTRRRPSWVSSKETSKLPPPRSYTSHDPWLLAWLQPAAIAEATGSCMSSTRSKPAKRGFRDCGGLMQLEECGH
jgi:NAD-specific glutamate dehydrogenase